MRADAVIRQEGMAVLFNKLAPVEAERFIYLLLSEPFNYTEWQRNLFEGMSLDELGQKAMENRMNKSKVLKRVPTVQHGNDPALSILLRVSDTRLETLYDWRESASKSIPFRSKNTS